MKRTLSSIAAAALVMGTLAPAAFASTAAVNYTDITAQYQFAAQDITNLSGMGYIHGFSDGTFRPQNSVTRGQLLAYFWNVVQQGAAPQADAQVYSDIAPGNWDFNFVGASFSKGWLNQYWLGVKPGYSFNENYHASYSDAASYFVAAMEKSGMITSTNGVAPLAYAKSVGLFQGIPASEMTANPVYMDRASAAVFLSNVMAFMNGQLLPAGATVTVVPASTNTAPGTTDQLSVAVKLADGSTYTLPSTAAIAYSVDNKAGFIGPTNQLVVTAAGTYNVVATVDGVQSQPVAITAFGAVANVKLAAT
ncbi:MAG: S-layer homology domain-containing protein, partial [Bacilli bacterium]